MPLGLAVLGARRGRLGAALAAIAALALVLALGQHTPAFDLARSLPFVDAQRYPEKLVLVATLTITMLAGHGADGKAVRAWLATPLSRTARLGWTASALLVLPLLTLVAPVTAWLTETSGPSALWSSLLPGVHSHVQGLIVHTALVSAALAVLVWAPQRWRGRAFAGLLMLSVADLAWVHRHSVPGAPSELVAGEAPPIMLGAFTGLAPDRSQPRVFHDARPGAPLTLAAENPVELRLHTVLGSGGPRVGAHWLRVSLHAREVLERNLGLVYGVRYLNGEFSPLQVQAHETYNHTLGAERGHLLMALAGVDFVMTPIQPHALAWDGPGFDELARHAGLNVRLLAVRSPNPRAYLAGRTVAWDPERGLEQLDQPGVAIGETVVVGGADRGPGGGAVDDTAAIGSVRVVVDAHERIVLEVTADRPAHVVVTESLLPGWSARVGAGVAVIDLANGRFMAVKMPAGTHTVELHYVAPGLRPGIAATMLGVVLVIVLVARRAKRRDAERLSRGGHRQPARESQMPG